MLVRPFLLLSAKSHNLCCAKQFGGQTPVVGLERSGRQESQQIFNFNFSLFIFLGGVAPRKKREAGTWLGRPDGENRDRSES